MRRLLFFSLTVSFLISSFLLFLTPLVKAQTSGPIIADHEAVISFNAGQIPSSYINLAKQNLRIAYGHTSHGSQIVTGMDMLADESSLYQYTSAFLQDGNIPGAEDLGNPDRTAWATATRNFLNENGSDRNVIMWSWCGQHYTDNPADIDLYLNLMSQLETEFPNVIFIYMTGHLNGDGLDGITYARNNQIRDYCRNHNKVLFDFADIESHDPGGVEYSDDSDACYWCSDWCSSHPCPSCVDCAHSHCFNCYQKGKALWWLVAQIAKRVEGPTSTPRPTLSPTPTPSGYVPECFGADSIINPDDLFAWGRFYSSTTDFDINLDNKINAFEAGYLFYYWGKTCVHTF